MDTEKHHMPGEPIPGQFEGYQTPGHDLSDYLAILYRRKWWVLAGLVTVVGLVVVQGELATPVWGAQAKILVAQQRSPFGSATDTASYAANPFMMGLRSNQNTQVAILNSKPMKEAAGNLLKRKPEFIEAMTSGRKRQLTPGDIRGLLKDYSLKYTTSGPPDRELRAITRSVSAKTLEKTDVILIQAASPNARLAHDYVNALSTVYLIGVLERNQRAATTCLAYVNEQLTEAQDRLHNAEMQVAAFSKEAGVIEPTQQARAEIERVAGLETRLLETRTSLRSSQAQLEQMNEQLAGLPQEVESGRTLVSNPMVAKLQEQLVDLNVQRNSLLDKYTESSTKVTAIDVQIASVEEALKAQVAEVTGSTTRVANPIRRELLGQIAITKAEIEAFRSAVSPLRRALAGARSEIARIPQSQIELARLMREKELAEQQYLMLRRKQQEYRLAQEAQVSGSELLEPARLSDRTRVSPRKGLNVLLGIMAGALLGLLLAFAAEQIRDTYPDAQTAAVDLGLPVIGHVPNVKGSDARRLLCAPDVDQAFRESFLSLYSNIGFSSPGGPPTSIVVSSGQASAGKTTVAANIALAAAEAQQRVLLIDADLRSPHIHDLLALEHSPGLSDLLTERATMDECVRRFVPRDGLELSVLPAGPSPPTPQALLNSRAMDDLLKKLQGQVDLVVIDAPPLGEMSDAQILASKAETVLLVFTQRNARRPALRAAGVQLARAHANVLGLVANRAPRPRKGYYS